MEAKGTEGRRIVKILAMRGTHRRNVEYQVRWKSADGYQLEWESSDLVRRNCLVMMLRCFHRKLSARSYAKLKRDLRQRYGVADNLQY